MVKESVTWFNVDDELCSVHDIGKQRWYIFYDEEGNYLDSKLEIYE